MIRNPLYRDSSTGFIQEVQPQDHLLVSYPDNEPSGFINRIDSVISFDESTRTFSISPRVSSFVIYLSSLPVVINNQQTVQLENVTGLHYIFYSADTGLLSSTTTQTDDLFVKHVLVSAIYWRADLQKQIYFADERHGITMDGVTHLHLHSTQGTQYVSGLSIQNILIGNGNNDSDVEFGISDGIIRDEDIKISIANNSPQTLFPIGKFPVLYKTNNVWNRTEPENFPLFLSPNNIPYYNYFDGTNWKISETSNDNYLLIHVLATNDINYPIQILMGNSYNSVRNAMTSISDEFSKLSGLLFTEFTIVGTLIYQVNATYNNIANAKIVRTVDGKEYIDWRKMVFSAISNTVSNVSSAITTFVKSLTGFTELVEYTEHNLSDIISYKIINNLQEEVSVVINTAGSSIKIDSNVDLSNHTLVLKGIV